MKSKGAKMCHDNVKAESYHQLSGIIFSLAPAAAGAGAENRFGFWD